MTAANKNKNFGTRSYDKPYKFVDKIKLRFLFFFFQKQYFFKSKTKNRFKTVHKFIHNLIHIRHVKTDRKF